MKRVTKNTPFFSVIIPTLNEEVCLPELLLSLSEQNISDFEVIVVDARSEDKTLEKIKSFKKRLNSLTNITSNKRNVAYQRNLGAKKASGKYLVYLDADIQIFPGFLKELQNQIIKLAPDILSSSMSTKGHPLKEKIVVTITNIFLELTKNLKVPVIFESMLVIKRDSFKRLGGFDSQMHNDEGSELVKKARIKNMTYVFVRSPKYYFSYRRAHKYGFLRVFFNVIYLEVMRAFDKKLSWEKLEELYPMQGGKIYNSKK